jgi:hypothetical protein
MADGAKFTIYYLLVNDGVVSSWLADSRRAIAHESAGNYFPSLISTEYTLVPRLAKSDELLLQATYHGSNVYDGCHSIIDKFIGGGYH